MPQATVKTYDSITKTGTLLSDDGVTEYQIDAAAIDSGMFRFLRPGQRVTFELVEKDDKTLAHNLRIGIA